jgi:hypothetical protein
VYDESQRWLLERSATALEREADQLASRTCTASEAEQCFLFGAPLKDLIDQHRRGAASIRHHLAR